MKARGSGSVTIPPETLAKIEHDVAVMRSRYAFSPLTSYSAERLGLDVRAVFVRHGVAVQAVEVQDKGWGPAGFGRDLEIGVKLAPADGQMQMSGRVRSGRWKRAERGRRARARRRGRRGRSAGA